MTRPIPFPTLALLLLSTASATLAQETGPPARDEVIVKALASISAERIEQDVRRLVGFGTRHTLSRSDADPTRGAPAASAWLAAELEAAATGADGRMTVSFDAFDPREFAGGLRPAMERLEVTSVRNVIAELKGTEPDRVLVVSGHYDSRASQRLDTTTDAPGANDDGSGTAVVLALARALAGVETRATILFALVTGEEQGLWGATHLARRLDRDGVAVEAMFTNDIVGGDRGADGASESDVVRVFSEGRPQTREDSHPRVVALARNASESDSPSRELARYVDDAARLCVPAMKARLVFRQDRFGRGGDHRPFNLLGWAAIRFTEPRENFDRQHEDVRTVDGRSYGDLPEHVDYAYVARVARVNAAALLQLARAPAPPREARMQVGLSNATSLAWDDVEDATVVGYRVLLRRTHEPTWTVRRDVGLIHEIEVPESKDDWLFAIQAVDAAGRASLPSFALPARRRR